MPSTTTTILLAALSLVPTAYSAEYPCFYTTDAAKQASCTSAFNAAQSSLTYSLTRSLPPGASVARGCEACPYSTYFPSGTTTLATATSAPSSGASAGASSGATAAASAASATGTPASGAAPAGDAGAATGGAPAATGGAPAGDAGASSGAAGASGGSQNAQASGAGAAGGSSASAKPSTGAAAMRFDTKGMEFFAAMAGVAGLAAFL